MKRKIIVTASIFGFLAVIAGAFGAHGLQPYLKTHQLEVWHTAVQYQFYHALALLFLASLGLTTDKLINTVYYLFTIGIIFFSGSLYLLACRDQIGLAWLWIMGPITPIGGLLFIAGWATLALAAFRNK